MKTSDKEKNFMYNYFICSPLAQEGKLAIFIHVTNCVSIMKITRNFVCMYSI